MGNTVITTQSNHPSFYTTHRTRQRLGFAVIGVACGAALLFTLVSFKQVVHFYALRQVTIDILHIKEQRTEAQQHLVLETVAAFKQDSTSMPPAVAGDFGYLAMLAAQWHNSQSLQGRLYALNAKVPLEKTVENRPSDTFAWSRLAFIYNTLLQPQKALNAWRMSVTAAPYEPTLLLWQVGFALPLYETLSAVDQHRVQQQVLNLWRFSRWQTAKILAEFERPELLRPRLIDREESKDFEQAYRYFLSVKERPSPHDPN
jgi:hypothetical protein